MSESHDERASEKLLLKAIVLSLVLHVVAYSTWRVGQAQGWWQNLAMPRWMQAVTKAIMPASPKIFAARPPAVTQLAFVEVDPALATPEPPKTPKYIGAKNTLAANKEIKKPSDIPNIDGRQQNYLKTTEFSKATPKPAPQPVPAPHPTETQNTPTQTAPKKSYVPGDLAMMRPTDKARDGKSESDSTEQADAQPQPEPQPAHRRPRTLAEAAAMSGLPGERSRQLGGVRSISTQPSLDVKSTIVGGYLDDMVRAVQARWDKLLENDTPNQSGKVVVSFRLHPNGYVTDWKILRNDVGELWGTTCVQAIKDPSPYPPWPREMRLDVPTDYYDLTFTFYYDLR